MDLTILIAAACLLIIVIVSFKFLTKPQKKIAGGHARPRALAQAEGGQGRAQMARNQRARMRANVARQAVAEVDEQEYEEGQDASGDELRGAERATALVDDKMGAKKRAKLEAKAEKKAAREAEEQFREEKKQREALQEEERKKQEEKERLDEQKREEEERKALEEKARREHEEYLAMKAAFSVDDEGFDENGENDGNQENLLKEFIDYIKVTKVVIIEDLAAQFKMKTQDTITRINDLQSDGLLTGVIDDRGKFIYISQCELDDVAKFIKQRGRVSIAELAESSNQLINMSSVKI